MMPECHTTRRLLLAGWLVALAVATGCTTRGPVAPSPAKESSQTSPTNQTSEKNESLAGQIHQLLYSLKTNAMAAAVKNQYPPQRVSDRCQAFLNALNQISPDLEFRLEFEPFVADLFLVDPRDAGACYGCKTNTIYLQNGGKLVAAPFAQGVAWVLPIGPDSQKALFILSSVGPQRTTIMLFDDPLHGRLLYDSYATPGSGGIDYLCGVEVVDQNHFLMHEGWLPGASQESILPRSFALSISDKLELQIEPQNPPP